MMKSNTLTDKEIRIKETHLLFQLLKQQKDLADKHSFSDVSEHIQSAMRCIIEHVKKDRMPT